MRGSARQSVLELSAWDAAVTARASGGLEQLGGGRGQSSV